MKKQNLGFSSALAGLLALALVTAIWPARAGTTRRTVANAQEAAETLSVSGKIASVEKNSFTLTVGSSATKEGEELRQTAPKTMNFLIDKNTTIEGRMQVGAEADVTYRVDSGKNIAMSVHLKP